ncbi:MAG: SRPBCC domain-containing protein [Saprospiraceae bacterium]|nr:SRPBCC domain-containing protein [Saprospiraceae bacterium]
MKINTSRYYAHPVDKVWDALTNPQALATWLMPNDFQLEKGHQFTFNTKPQGNFDGIVHCRILEFEIPHSLSYAWRGGKMKTDTIVRWTLREQQGGTKLELEHSGFEGINGWFIKQLLGFGWKRTLLAKKLSAYLDEKA